MTTIKIHYDYDIKPELYAELRSRLNILLKDFPHSAKGVVYLNGVEYFYAYVSEIHEKKVSVMERVAAEALLSSSGLSTVETWCPWTKHNA